MAMVLSFSPPTDYSQFNIDKAEKVKTIMKIAHTAERDVTVLPSDIRVHCVAPWAIAFAIRVPTIIHSLFDALLWEVLWVSPE